MSDPQKKLCQPPTATSRLLVGADGHKAPLSLGGEAKAPNASRSGSQGRDRWKPRQVNVASTALLGGRPI